MSRQNVCRDKHIFVVTKDGFCREKHMLVATKSDTGDNDTLRHHKRTRKHHALKSQYHTISFYVFLIVSLVVYIIYIGDFISLSIGAVLIFSNFR